MLEVEGACPMKRESLEKSSQETMKRAQIAKLNGAETVLNFSTL